MKSRRLDVLRVVEAAYELGPTDEEWLKSVAEAVRPHLDDDFGLAAFEFVRVGDEPPTMLQSQHLWMPESLAAVYPRMFASMPPELRVRPFRLGPCVSGSEMMNMKKEFADLPQMKDGLQKFGMFDSIWITATDPMGRGCGFHAGRKTIAWATAAEKRRWGRVAAHLSSLVRLRSTAFTLQDVAYTFTALVLGLANGLTAAPFALVVGIDVGSRVSALSWRHR
jgi:hypothetical protein